MPSVSNTSVSHWNKYEDIEKTYNKIINYKTTRDELHSYGFNPFDTANISILSHLDIKRKFLVTSSVKLSDLDKGLAQCIKSENACTAYESTVKYTTSKRFGSVLLDLFGFRKYTREQGWSFYSLIVLNNDTVVYKVSNSKPQINNIEKKNNPLGPFQSMESVLKNTVN